MRTESKTLALAALALSALLAGAPAAAAALAPAQVYYLPLPENQIYAALRSIYSAGAPAFCNTNPDNDVSDPILTYVSIAPAADGTVIVYDHWEDGYEPDLSRPAQPSTEVWGDGDPANGMPPGFTADQIGVGDVVVLDNPVRIGTRAAVLDFDGGDKLAASAPISVTRAAWATGTGTLLAGAVEVRELRSWGHAYRAPVGQDVAGTEMFEHTSLLVMGSRDGTRVAIDADADGSAEISVTLGQGQSHHVRGGVRAGAAVSATEPVQVSLITGDVCARIQSRWYSLEPAHRWSASAYAPVGTGADDPTTVYVFNPGAAPVTVRQQTRSGADVVRTVAAGAVRPFPVPPGSAARFSSQNGEPILAVGAVDTGGSEHEWGFSLIPETLLTPQALTGWGAGRDPLSDVNPGENGSPVWVTPAPAGGSREPVAVCVDFDGDNSGTETDAAGYRYDRLLSLEPLTSTRVYDPDGDQTGMILYVCDESDARLAVAWGQDPATATPGQPGIDLGTTVPPLPSMSAVKEAELAVDVDGDGLVDPGDTLRYTVRVLNISRRPVGGLVVSDELPAHTSYVAGSASVDRGRGPVPLPDAGVTAYPLDEGGASFGILPAGASLAVAFLAVVDERIPADVRAIENVAIVRSDAGEIEVEADLPLTPWESRPSLALEKTAVVETVAAPGTGTLGYWKNHPEAWPVAEITVGGRTYFPEQAIALLGTPGRGDRTYDLYRQFVPARLNVLVGNGSSCIEATLAAADAWLAQHPPGSGVTSGDPAWSGAGAALQATLDQYNNGLLCAPHRDTAAGGAVRLDAVFTIVVTNTGNVELTGVRVQDPAMPACDVAVGTLAASGGSASTTCRAAGVQADLTNVAFASGVAPDGARVEARAEVFVDIPGVGQDGAGDTPGAALSLAQWRGAPGAWPVLELTLGGETRTAEGILAALDACRRGDPSCALLGQLAAARLNLLGGSDPSCMQRSVRAADAWLAAHPPGSRPAAKGAPWAKAGQRLATALARYNRGLLCAPPAAP